MEKNFNTLLCESTAGLPTLYFDMDGTLADFYSVPSWLAKLEAEDPSPYAEARPLIDINELGALCVEYQAYGGKIGIISWLSKASSKTYDKAVRVEKKKWLKTYLPLKFNEIHIVKYGTPKHYVAKDKMGILFDDEKRNCERWKGTAINVTEENLIEIIKLILRKLG